LTRVTWFRGQNRKSSACTSTSSGRRLIPRRNHSTLSDSSSLTQPNFECFRHIGSKEQYWSEKSAGPSIHRPCRARSRASTYLSRGPRWKEYSWSLTGHLRMPHSACAHPSPSTKSRRFVLGKVPHSPWEDHQACSPLHLDWTSACQWRSWSSSSGRPWELCSSALARWALRLCSRPRLPWVLLGWRWLLKHVQAGCSTCHIPCTSLRSLSPWSLWTEKFCIG